MMQALWELDRGLFKAIHEAFRLDPLQVLLGIISMSGVGHVHIAPLLFVWAKARESQFFLYSMGCLLTIVVALLGHLDDALVPQLIAFALLAWGVRKLPVEIAKTAILAFVISGVIHILMKAVIPRERPSNFDWAVPLENVYSTRSFPSGHTSTAFAIGLVLLLQLEDRRLGWLALLWGFMVGISRITVGVHFPSDVLGGFGVGIIGAAAAILIADRWSRRRGSPTEQMS
jgi:membrane-associated phospholipid phosphatase